jgi:hypothetical protein
MIGKIETTEDINQEKERLTAEAEMHKQQLKNSIETLQNEVKVSKVAKDVLRSETTPEVLKYAAGVGTFVLINTILPRRTSWLIRMTLPFFANRYLVKYIDQNYSNWSEQLVDKIDQQKTERQLNAAL